MLELLKRMRNDYRKSFFSKYYFLKESTFIVNKEMEKNSRVFAKKSVWDNLFFSFFYVFSLLSISGYLVCVAFYHIFKVLLNNEVIITSISTLNAFFSLILCFCFMLFVFKIWLTLAVKISDFLVFVSKNTPLFKDFYSHFKNKQKTIERQVEDFINCSTIKISKNHLSALDDVVKNINKENSLILIRSFKEVCSHVHHFKMLENILNKAANKEEVTVNEKIFLGYNLDCLSSTDSNEVFKLLNNIKK